MTDSLTPPITAKASTNETRVIVTETRPWGRYEIIDDAATYKVKCIHIEPDQRLSYQRHSYRAEHWTVISGKLEVVRNGAITHHYAGESVFIPQGMLHRAGALNNEPAVFIEVQTGTYFGEDDIVRVEDDYGREA